jgi:hypothetical protein
MSYIVLANLLLTWTKEFGNQFGGDRRFTSKHEIYAIEQPGGGPEEKPVADFAMAMEGRDSEL